jgi:hypothetical protein
MTDIAYLGDIQRNDHSQHTNRETSDCSPSEDHRQIRRDALKNGSDHEDDDCQVYRQLASQPVGNGSIDQRA